MTAAPESRDDAQTVTYSRTAFMVAVPAASLLVGIATTLVTWPRYGVASLDAAAAGAVTTLSAILALLALFAIAPKTPTTFAQGVLAAGIGRTMIALLGAVGLYLVRDPAQGPYWAAFLLGSVGSLIVETTLAIRVLRNASTRRNTQQTTEGEA